MGLNLERYVNGFFSKISVNWDNITSLAIQQEDASPNRNFGNKGSVLVEEAFFLYSLVRMTKPKYIVDAGTYIGVSAMFMQEAVRDNGLGKIVSVEHHTIAHETARRLLSVLGYDEVELIKGKIEEFTPSSPVDFLFLDTETEDRVAQFNYLKQFFAPECWVVFHDAGACDDIDSIDQPFLHFHTVRGLRVFHAKKS